MQIPRRAPLFTALWLCALSACFCGEKSLPIPPVECDSVGVGCLIDEVCVQGRCQKLPPCEADEDCPTPAYTCVFPSQVCELRQGFGDECANTAECTPGEFCALGLCLVIDDARQCARRADCPFGQACDQVHFFCIDEGPCTLEDDFPELTCDPGEVCETFSGRCSLPCQEQCTPATELEDCGVGQRCDGACRCVQCLTTADCGPGLICNLRAGRCESENLCFSDDECESPLICDPGTALCQVAPPPCATDFDCEIAEICNRNTGICELPGGACDDDRFENADTPATAEGLEIENDGSIVVYEDLRLCPDDDDVYAVPLLPGDHLIARIQETAALARATVWLLDEAGELSLRFAEAPPYGDGTVVYVASVEQTVFLRVNALLGQTPYEMEVSIAQGLPCAPDLFESDSGNDSVETSTPAVFVPVDQELTAELCNDDLDHLTVHLLEGEAVQGTLTFDHTEADLDLAVLDTTGVVLDASAGLLSPERVFFRSPFERDIVVRVSGYAGGTGAYTLRLDRLPAFECTEDIQEPDDLVEDATLLSLGDVLENEERTMCEADVELYAVPLEDFHRLVVIAEFATEDIDMQIRILDETGVEQRAISPDSAGGETLAYNAQGNETVLLELTGLFNTKGPYSLNVFRENQADCLPDEFEPNETPSAAPVSPTSALDLTLCGSDEDVYAVEGVAGKLLSVDAAFLHADGDIDLMILGIDGVQPLAIADGIGNVESLQTVLPIDGTYYVRVFSLSEDVKARYALSAELSDD